jgi:hypothetical protein
MYFLQRKDGRVGHANYTRRAGFGDRLISAIPSAIIR